METLYEKEDARKLQITKYDRLIHNIFHKSFEEISIKELIKLFESTNDKEFEDYLYDLICQKEYLEDNVCK